jgi:hypothetical protein
VSPWGNRNRRDVMDTITTTPGRSIAQIPRRAPASSGFCACATFVDQPREYACSVVWPTQHIHGNVVPACCPPLSHVNCTWTGRPRCAVRRPTQVNDTGSKAKRRASSQPHEGAVSDIRKKSPGYHVLCSLYSLHSCIDCLRIYRLYSHALFYVGYIILYNIKPFHPSYIYCHSSSAFSLVDLACPCNVPLMRLSCPLFPLRNFPDDLFRLGPSPYSSGVDLALFQDCTHYIARLRPTVSPIPTCTLPAPQCPPWIPFSCSLFAMTVWSSFEDVHLRAASLINCTDVTYPLSSSSQRSSHSLSESPFRGRFITFPAASQLLCSCLQL